MIIAWFTCHWLCHVQHKRGICPERLVLHSNFSVPDDYRPPHVATDLAMRKCLLKSDLDGAYRVWCRRAEHFLLKIHLQNSGFDSGLGRGRAGFRKLTVFPPEGSACADTVWCCRVAKALRQTQELGRMRQWGYRAEVTIAHIRKFAGEAQGPFAVAMQEVLGGVLSRDSIPVLRHVLEEEYSRAKRLSEQARLKAWKSRLQSSDRQCYKWIKGEKAKSPAPMKTRSGEYTVDRNVQLEEILTEWLPIFHKFKVNKPDVASFTEHFGQFLKSSPMSLSSLTGADLVNAARATSPSAASLDSWRPSAIAALAVWFPMLFEDLAVILNKVEELGEWPQDLLSSYTSLIPKDEQAVDVSARDFRPITVLDAIYRLYAKARFIALLQWQESWVSEKCKNAETLAIQIAMDLESTGYTSFQYVAGVSYDCRKAFDLVPIEIALEIMRRRGCHPHILSALHGLYNGLHRVFRLHGAVGN